MTLKTNRDQSMMFTWCLSLCANYPPQKSAVKLANSKATEVFRVYLAYGVTVTEREGYSWVFYCPDEGRNVR